MNIGDLFKPLREILDKAINAEVDEAAVGKLVLHLLGDQANDSVTVQHFDDCIKGGAIVEAVDGSIGEAYIKKLRAWAESKIE